ncbi:hypothetical protein EXIGLDRAFT_766566 [Exidia glandulosa HHB12029]|uniref:Zn(2)-C6 fungal-type domain-containing protein n=1 Tax=Exidia glandulosa HHB12029 TaxID=1314781 RepID=A0A165JN14_EXIGL|nr:hypothetical protein EXIGLDRAFT_766566 [Exidia glandulosa HHB12029]
MSEHGRNGKHVASACKGCRKRKAKCDGQPNVTCSKCKTHGDQCIWTTEQDGRRTVTRDQAQALRSRVDALEHENRQLQEQNRVLRAGQQSATDRLQLSITIPEHRNVKESFGGFYTPLTTSIPSIGAVHDTPNSGSSYSWPSGSHSSSSASAGTTSNSAHPLNAFRLPHPPPNFLFSRQTSPITAPGSAAEVGSNPFVRLFASFGKQLLTLPHSDVRSPLPGSSPNAYLLDPANPVSDTTQILDAYFDVSPQTWALPTPYSIIPSVNGFIFQQPALNVAPLAFASYLPAFVLEHLSIDVHTAIIQDYLDSGTALHLSGIPHLFWRDLHVVLTSGGAAPAPITAYFSPSLHCAILAECGTATLSAINPNIPYLLISRARELAELECAGSSYALAAIQALAIVARFHISRGPEYEPVAYGALSTAVHMTSRHGLNGASPEDGRWARAWCYMSLFIQVVHLSLHTGFDLLMEPPSQFLLASHPPEGVANPDEWELFIRAASLSIIVNSIAKMNSPTQNEAFAVQVELSNWLAALPSEHALAADAPAHVLQLHMTHAWATILLHRPYYSSATAQQDSTSFIDKSGERFFRILKYFDERQDLNFVRAPFSLVQMTFMAGAAALVRLTMLSPNANKRRNMATGYAMQARDALHAMAATWPCAAKYADVLTARIAPTSGIVSYAPAPAPTSPIPAYPQPQMSLPSWSAVLTTPSSGTYFDPPANAWSLPLYVPEAGEHDAFTPQWMTILP